MTYDTAVAALGTGPGPAGYWPCQETTGTTLVEGGYAAGDGSIVGGATVDDTTDPACPAAIGKHIRLDASNDYLTLPEGSTWFTPATNGFTWTGWVYIRAYQNWSRLFDFNNDTYFIPCQSNQTAILYVNGTGTQHTTQTPPAGAWVFFAVTVTAAGVRKIYANNNLVYSGTGNVPTNGTRANMWVGRAADGSAYLSASVTRLAVWNEVLSDNDLKELWGQSLNAPVGKVTRLIAAPFSNSALASWVARADAVKYEYRVDGGAGTLTYDTEVMVTGLTNGVQSTIEVRSVNPAGNGPWESVKVTPVAGYVYDKFNRADSTSVVGTPDAAGPYTVQTGTLGISGNALYASAVVSGNAIITVAAASDVNVQGTLGSSWSGMGLVFRYVSDTDYWLAHLTSNQIVVYSKSGGTLTERARSPFSKNFVQGDIIRVHAKGEVIQVHRNDKVEVTLNDDTYTGAKTIAGVRFDNTAPRLDSLVISNILWIPDAGAMISENFAATLPESAGLYKGRDTKVLDIGGIA